MYKKISTKHIEDSEWLDSGAEMPIVDEKDLAIEIGGNIAEARIACGLTQVDLAKKMKTYQSSIARVERGNTLPTNKFLLRVAEALETSLIAPTFASIFEEAEMEEETKTETDSPSEGFVPWVADVWTMPVAVPAVVHYLCTNRSMGVGIVPPRKDVATATSVHPFQIA